MAEADYTQALADLLPPGEAFRAFHVEGTRARALLGVFSLAWCGVDARAVRLLAEANPLTVDEMLASREVEAGLPGPCDPEDATVAQRRAALVAKWRGRGGQSPQFFIDLIAAYGFTIAVTEFHPFIADGSDAEDPLTNDNWTHVWQVDGPAQFTREFLADSNSAGDPIRDWDTTVIPCLIAQAKPAHTRVIFNFSVEFEE